MTDEVPDKAPEKTPEKTLKKPNMWARRKARRALVQAAYQWQVSGTGIAQLRKEFGEKALTKPMQIFLAKYSI